MKRLVTLVCALVFAGPVMAQKAASMPNIIVILCDDLGQGDPGSYNPKSKTPMPNVDRLAKEGMRFTDAHTPSSVCTPTRYGTLTGRYCWRSKLKRGVLWNGWANALIEKDRPTIASMLKPAGYTSVAIGKWHLGWNWKSKNDKAITAKYHPAEVVDYDSKVDRGPGAVGFDYCYLIPASLDMAPYLWLVNDKAMAAPTAHTKGSRHRRGGGGGFWRAGAMQPGFDFYEVLPNSAQVAMKFIHDQGLEQKAGKDKPFFLYLPLASPHTPWVPNKEFQGKTKAGWYGDFVVETDWAVGQVLKTLDRNGLAENTIVIFTSDNGSHWPEGDIKKWGHDANNGWRGQKADIHEGGHRVPFIVRWPGVVKPGSVSDQTICLTDIYATVAEAVGHKLKKDEAEDSVSLMPILKGKATKPVREAVVHHSLGGMFAIRKGDWKLILGLGSGGFTKINTKADKAAGFKGQLYNLKDDPQEKNNLWKAEPQIVKELTDLLEKYKKNGRSR